MNQPNRNQKTPQLGFAEQIHRSIELLCLIAQSLQRIERSLRDAPAQHADDSKGIIPFKTGGQR